MLDVLPDYISAVQVIVALFTAVFATIYILVSYLSHSPRPVDASELEFYSVSTRGTLPNLQKDPASIKISVVVPCYNEEERLPLLLKDAVPYLNSKYGNSWELLIVDDGSKDRTRDVAFEWAQKLEMGSNFRYCKLVSNRGKGGAVTHGMNVARGELILFADADNASDFTCLENLVKAVTDSSVNSMSVAIGSRAHLVNTQQVIKRSKLRNVLMRGFHLLVYWFGIRTIRDTQCGFKLYTRSAAIQIFPYMHTEGWIFDVETLVIATKKKIPVHEIPISWHEVTGSKIDLARDSIKMAIDLVIIRFAYLFGIYKYTETKPAL